MKKKLLVLDVDGTLMNSRKEITPATKEAIIGLMKRGHMCMLASGRPLPGMKGVADELEFERYGGYLLSYNGAKIVKYDTGETIYEQNVPREYLKEVYEFATANDCGLISYQDGEIISGNGVDEYMEREAGITGMIIREVDDFPGFFSGDVVKCLLSAKPDRTEGLEQKLKKQMGERANVFRSEPFYVEVMPLGVDKATSIAHMLSKIGLTREDCVACGDGFNDISMIQYAGIGVAMGNANQAVKDAADIITGTNDEDGLIPIIDQYFK